MDHLLENPAGLLAVLCLVGVVLLSTLGIVPLLRGGSSDFLRRLIDPREGEAWRKAFTGGREAQRRQAQEMDELHRLVSQLPKGDKGQEMDEE
jgi:hypothetical protein